MNETFRKKWLPVFDLFFGLFIIGYYPVTELIDSLRRQQAIDNLEQTVYETDDSKREAILAQARAWNRLIAGKDPGMLADDILSYERQITADGADTSIGYVVVPSLSLSMPIYHGTGNAALSAGCGHLDYTSLPVGGNNTHTAITAHSGMSNMRAFDDIRDLEPGDVIGISVLGTMRFYRVTESETVLPTEVESLDIQPGRDLCTLITCTPYGINTPAAGPCHKMSSTTGVRAGTHYHPGSRHQPPDLAVPGGTHVCDHGAHHCLAALPAVQKGIWERVRKEAGTLEKMVHI